MISSIRVVCRPGGEFDQMEVLVRGEGAGQPALTRTLEHQT